MNNKAITRWNVALDANVFQENSESVKRIFSLHEEERIVLLTPYTLLEENASSNAPLYVQDRIFRFVFTKRVELNYQEIQRRDQFIQRLRGKAKPKNIDADLGHIWEAAKSGAQYFITRDKRLLRCYKPDIWSKELGVWIKVVTPEDFLAEFLKELAYV